MAKMTWLCCQRCGDLFEGTEGTEYCIHCRKVVFNGKKKILVCKVCGKEYLAGKESRTVFCAECKAKRLSEQRKAMPPVERIFDCDVCGAKFTTTAKWAFRCPTCRKAFQNLRKRPKALEKYKSEAAAKKSKQNSITDIIKKPQKCI